MVVPSARPPGNLTLPVETRRKVVPPKSGRITTRSGSENPKITPKSDEKAKPDDDVVDVEFMKLQEKVLNLKRKNMEVKSRSNGNTPASTPGGRRTPEKVGSPNDSCGTPNSSGYGRSMGSLSGRSPTDGISNQMMKPGPLSTRTKKIAQQVKPGFKPTSIQEVGTSDSNLFTSKRQPPKVIPPKVKKTQRIELEIYDNGIKMADNPASSDDGASNRGTSRGRVESDMDLEDMGDSSGRHVGKDGLPDGLSIDLQKPTSCRRQQSDSDDSVSSGALRARFYGDRNYNNLYENVWSDTEDENTPSNAGNTPTHADETTPGGRGSAAATFSSQPPPSSGNPQDDAFVCVGLGEVIDPKDKTYGGRMYAIPEQGGQSTDTITASTVTTNRSNTNGSTSATGQSSNTTGQSLRGRPASSSSAKPLSKEAVDSLNETVAEGFDFGPAAGSMKDAIERNKRNVSDHQKPAAKNALCDIKKPPEKNVPGLSSRHILNQGGNDGKGGMDASSGPKIVEVISPSPKAKAKVPDVDLLNTEIKQAKYVARPSTAPQGSCFSAKSMTDFTQLAGEIKDKKKELDKTEKKRRSLNSSGIAEGMKNSLSKEFLPKHSKEDDTASVSDVPTPSSTRSLDNSSLRSELSELYKTAIKIAKDELELIPEQALGLLGKSCLLQARVFEKELMELQRKERNRSYIDRVLKAGSSKTGASKLKSTITNNPKPKYGANMLGETDGYDEEPENLVGISVSPYDQIRENELIPGAEMFCRDGSVHKISLEESRQRGVKPPSRAGGQRPKGTKAPMDVRIRPIKK